MTKPSGQTVFLGSVIVVGVLILGYMALTEINGREQRPAKESKSAPRSLKDIPFDGGKAYEYLKQICAIGPRFSGSAGMEKQQKLLTDHFEKLNAKVVRQEFKARNPLTGKPVTMANLVVEWHPDRKERVLLCAHYDTRPFPDRDRRNPRGRFIGANDGASGVAVLMELGKHMAEFDSRFGVDFVLFDAEELVYQEGDPYSLGAEHFAREYVAEPPGHSYRWGVLLDMVGDKDLQLYQEVNSVSWADTRPLVDQIWRVAARLGVREFIPQSKHTVIDDHIKLHDIAGIPTCDIIDFDFDHWHTEQDVPANCSALSLAKVGWVLHEWLLGLK